MGYYADDGRPIVSKQAVAAFRDGDFAREAREVALAHLCGPRPLRLHRRALERNTHPFEQDGRLFAHNGVIEGLDLLEAELGDAMSLVSGDTDSERFFALITRETRRTGDVGEGITAAARWVAEQPAAVRDQPRAHLRRGAVGAALPRQP